MREAAPAVPRRDDGPVFDRIFLAVDGGAKRRLVAALACGEQLARLLGAASALPKYQPCPICAAERARPPCRLPRSRCPRRRPAPTERRASVVTARTIAALSRLALMLVTKLRSILMMSNGSERRCASDEKPVPKSSSASRTPWFLRLVTMRPRKVDVGEQRAFGDFDHQPLGRESRSRPGSGRSAAQASRRRAATARC